MSIALRPYLPSDAQDLARLFQASVEGLAREDYSGAQCAAWASTADDIAAFSMRLGGALTLVAMEQGRIVGFCSLKDGKIDMLYAHPQHTRRGVATALLDALEKLAAARNAVMLEADVSEAASAFFIARGYAPQSRNSVLIGDEWLANTTMKKNLS